MSLHALTLVDIRKMLSNKQVPGHPISGQGFVFLGISQENQQRAYFGVALTIECAR